MKITAEQFESACREIGLLVTTYGDGSAVDGLSVVAHAFGVILDVYAKPNADNPEGMCDDPVAFRAYFAGMIANPGLGTEGGTKE